MDRRFGAVTADMDRRFGEVDRRFTEVRTDIDRLDSKLDARFNVQTVLMTVVGVLVMFGDSLRTVLGL